MSTKLIKELPELLENKVISQDVADTIQAYYTSQDNNKPNRLFTVFGVLGAALVGLGIILILAHNWDNFSRTIKTIWAFLPLVVGQLFAGFSIAKQKSKTWKEASGVFLFFAVGASIALVSQIYNIPGNLGAFLLTWILLCTPLMYLLKSKAVGILHLVFATYYVFEYGYSYPSHTPWYYLLFLAAFVPFYYRLLKEEAKANITSIFNWLIPLSITICLGAFLSRKTGELGFLMYITLFGLFYGIGKLPFFQNQKLRRNGYAVFGSVGTIITLMFVTFRWFWKDLANGYQSDMQSNMVFAVLFCAALGVLGYSYYKKWIKGFNLFHYVFLICSALFVLGLTGWSIVVPTVLMNLLVLTLGLITIKIGADQFHFGILNYGLLIVTAMVVCRFFDTNISFVIRGLLFVAVGLGFFLTNYIMLKKQKSKTL